jgi:hypothetical protein
VTQIVGYIIGIRIGPDHSDPDWFTVWYENASSQNRVATRNGRIQWVSSLEAVRVLTFDSGDVDYTIRPKLDGVCDVAGALHQITGGHAGDETVVLLFLNLLDDMLLTVRDLLPSESRRLLDRLVVRLTEGASLPEAVEAAGGVPQIVEAIMASLGRVFARSTMTCA